MLTPQSKLPILQSSRNPGETSDAQKVLVSPGGPGDSSVDIVLLDFEAIQNKIASKYSLISIDPHGVKISGPSSDCLPGYSSVARNTTFSNVFTVTD
jgi:hypothetical protein